MNIPTIVGGFWREQVQPFFDRLDDMSRTGKLATVTVLVMNLTGAIGSALYLTAETTNTLEKIIIMLAAISIEGIMLTAAMSLIGNPRNWKIPAVVVTTTTIITFYFNLQHRLSINTVVEAIPIALAFPLLALLSLGLIYNVTLAEIQDRSCTYCGSVFKTQTYARRHEKYRCKSAPPKDESTK